MSIADGIPLDYERRNRRIARSGEESYIGVRTTRVTEAYFETLGTPLVRGRAFDEADVYGTEPVAVITASLAERLWPGHDALGQRIRYARDRNTVMELTVVGVASDVAGSSHESEPTNVFVPLWQHPAQRNTLVVRAASENQGIARAIQDVTLELDPNLTRPTVQTSLSLMEAAKRGIYVVSLFVGVLTLLTLLLAALGVYGVVAFAVASRTREIGIRMAIGATRRRVLMSVLADGAKLAVPGIVLGSLLAVIVARPFLGRWYQYLGRTTLDLAMLGIGAGIAFAVVLVASGMPARRAAGVQPMAALRED